MVISKRMLKVLIAICGLLLLCTILQFVPILPSVFGAPREAASIGIIGAADGPTTILVAGALWTHLLLPVLCFLLEVFLCVYVLVKSVKALKRP